MRHDQLDCVAADQAVPDGSMSDRQILADQRPWRRVFGKIPKHFCLCAGNFGVWPVIAYAVAQAILQVMLEGGTLRMIVFGPIARIGLHAGDHDITEAGNQAGLDPLVFDRVEGPERLTQRESQTRTNLQDREMILHQCRECRRCLIIGRMGFVDELLMTFDHGLEREDLPRQIIDDLAAIEFDPRLNDNCDHAMPGVDEARRCKDRPMPVDRGAGCLGRGDSKRVQPFRGTAGSRNLGSDDIDRRLAARVAMVSLDNAIWSSAQGIEQSRWILRKPALT